MSEEEPLRRILAMGGGGFTMEPDNPALDDFALSLTGKREPRVLFLPTASGDFSGQITAFQARFGGRLCTAEYLSLFRLRDVDRSLPEIVLAQDLIYVGGGSLRNLLALWGAHGIDRLLVEAWRRGTVLAGLSAGAMCWFEGGVTRSSGPPEVIAGLGLLPGSLSVHADGEPERLPVFLDAVRRGELPGGWAADDGVGLLFEGERLARVVTSRPGTSALRVDAIEHEMVRRRVEPELLGGGTSHEPPPPGDDVLEMREVARMRSGYRNPPR